MYLLREKYLLQSTVLNDGSLWLLPLTPLVQEDQPMDWPVYIVDT